ncbi:lamb YcsF family protein [Suillus lakei]|nr:lamb YcsF family protein [Suillus lakei]
MSKPLKATVNCDMGEGFSLYTIGDDEGLMKTIHLANVACGFHASDFSVMNKTVALAKSNNVLVGAHPSLPDLQGFGRREMAIEPDELESCFIYQVGALDGFLKRYGLPMNHIKPHGSVYGQTARSIDLARAVVGVTKIFKASAATPQAHQQASEELGVPFIAVPIDVVRQRVNTFLGLCCHKVSTIGGKLLDIGANVAEVSICCHSDTPGAVEIAQAVRALVDESNREAGYV